MRHSYRRVYLDSSPFIYFIQENPSYISFVENLFKEITDGHLLGISSYLSLLEVLVQPIEQEAFQIAVQYERFMLDNEYLKLYPLDKNIARRAAGLRARYKSLKTPDAVQIATAIENNAEIFITNDKALKQVIEIKVLLLDEL